jgi:hypothetical protein
MNESDSSGLYAGYCAPADCPTVHGGDNVINLAGSNNRVTNCPPSAGTSGYSWQVQAAAKTSVTAIDRYIQSVQSTQESCAVNPSLEICKTTTIGGESLPERDATTCVTHTGGIIVGGTALGVSVSSAGGTLAALETAGIVSAPESFGFGLLFAGSTVVISSIILGGVSSFGCR